MNKNIKVMEMPKRKKAVGFVKSRKSHSKIHQFCQEIYNYGLGKRICIEEFIVDETAGCDVDREPVDKLMECLESGKYQCVVVPSLHDITKDGDDLAAFLIHLCDMDCTVYSIEESSYTKMFCRTEDDADI